MLLIIGLLLNKPYKCKASLNICLNQLNSFEQKSLLQAIRGVRIKSLEASRTPHGLPKISLFKPLSFLHEARLKKSVVAFPFRVVMNISVNSGNFNLNRNQITARCYEELMQWRSRYILIQANICVRKFNLKGLERVCFITNI